MNYSFLFSLGEGLTIYKKHNRAIHSMDGQQTDIPHQKGKLN